MKEGGVMGKGKRDGGHVCVCVYDDVRSHMWQGVVRCTACDV